MLKKIFKKLRVKGYLLKISLIFFQLNSKSIVFKKRNYYILKNANNKSGKIPRVFTMGMNAVSIPLAGENIETIEKS